MKIYLITKNSGKLLAAKNVFSDNRIELCTVEKDYPEIQADTSLEIAQYTSIQVARELNSPAIREDHSFCLNGLKGVPGPYMNHFNRKFNEFEILELYKNISDRRGYFEVATVLAFPNGKTLESVFKVNFTLSTEPRGNLQSGWNRLIILDGETRTLAEYSETERINIWNQGYLDIKKQLSKEIF